MFNRSKPRGESTSNVNGTEGFVWSTENALGRGATAVVYRGASKTTGEPVAVKIFSSPYDFHESQIREMEMLKQLDHENIVKLITIQREFKKGNHVVVMELCEGLSMGSILDDPEYARGFNEEEFLLVLEHVTAGMRYLRSNGIAHRDLKPANVVKFITDDGRNVYKLTDFGAAKAIEEDEYFKSLCGTEEYLYPDIYDKAIMKSPENKQFPASVDLWSMGCTIYHVVTGSVPFRPYGGRRNHKAMQFIHNHKQPGVISAIQKSDGTVEWSRELPKDCQLSPDMREMVTTLLQGLLEKDKMWTFTQYFTAVGKILNKIPVYIFDVQNCIEHKLYVDEDETVQDFKEHVQLRTCVQQENQIIIHKRKILDLDCNAAKAIEVLQETSMQEPIILISKGNGDLKMTDHMVSSPPLKFPSFGVGIVSVEQDLPIAKEFTNVSYVFSRHIEEVTRCQVLLLEVPVAMNSVIVQRIEELHQSTTQSLEQELCLNYILKAFMLLIRVLPPLETSQRGTAFSNGIKKLEKQRKIVNLTFHTLRGKVAVLYTKYVSERHLDVLWQKSLKNCGGSAGIKETAKSYVGTIHSSWQTLLELRNKNPLTLDDNEFAKLEKIKISLYVTKLKSLDKLGIDNLQRSVNEFDPWYNAAQAVLVQCECLRTELHQSNVLLKDYDTGIKKEQDTFKELEPRLTSGSSSRRNDVLHKEKRSEELNGLASEVLNSLREIKYSQNSTKALVEETTSAVNNFNSLISELSQLQLDQCNEEQ